MVYSLQFYYIQKSLVKIYLENPMKLHLGKCFLLFSIALVLGFILDLLLGVVMAKNSILLALLLNYLMKG